MCCKVFSCILIFLSINLSSAAEKIVRIATLEDYAPFCTTLGEYEENQIIQVGNDAVGFQGYSWDVLRDSFHEMGYTIQLSIAPWARAMSYVKNGKVDILFPTGKNAERQRVFHYSEESINQANFVIYVRVDDPIEWRGLETFKGLLIGVKRGFNYGDKWKAATYIKKTDFGTILAGFQMLGQKRLDGVLGYERTWDYVLKKENWENKFRKLPVFDSSAEYLVALKSNPKGIEHLT